MKLKTNAEGYYNDISESIRAFIDIDTITLTDENEDITVSLTEEKGNLTAKALCMGMCGEHTEEYCFANEIEKKKIEKRACKLAVYSVMKKITGMSLPWGSLTGIRPTKLLREFDCDIEKLNRLYDLPLDKGNLLKRICDNQGDIFYPQANETDVYIGIPFCKTRCSYCSFSSTDSTKGEKLMKPYVETLVREIEETAGLINRLGKSIRCVYIGGGTPTALTEELFDIMLKCASEHFKPTMEFTVEAGRPDTITEHKLNTMKQCGVQRISINPQSMNRETLEKIGRSHTPEEIEECFALARKIGFDTINADLIAGLPGEDYEMFLHTLDRVLKLSPENITVHTLALKRGSIMYEKNIKSGSVAEVAKMVEGAKNILIEKGYEPYYLYRQKYMTGNFENIGYAKKGHIGVYNIDIMEETSDIFALGCGAVSKRIFIKEDKIERAFNFKSIYEYNSRLEEMLERKIALFVECV